MTVELLKSLSLGGQVDCVRRELRKRHSAYPAMVSRGQIRQGQAEYELAAMGQVLKTLQWLQRHETTVRQAIEAEQAAERRARAEAGVSR